MNLTGTKLDIEVKRGFSVSGDEVEAVRELSTQINKADASAVIVFVSSKYDLRIIGDELKNAFSVPVIGCSTSGEVTPDGYGEHSITGVSLASNRLKTYSFEIDGLRNGSSARMAEIGEQVRKLREEAKAENPDIKSFGLLLIDGLSVMEEHVIGHLYGALGNIPIIGGSAGDDLGFAETYVYSNGEFKSDTAVFTLFLTSLPFNTFKTQHFVPTEEKLVVTEAEPAKRIITEINGNPAAEEYANLVGMGVEELNPTVFSNNPVMLKIGGDYYVRSIQKANPDGSLTFYCAIEEGLVLTLGKGEHLVTNLEKTLAEETAKIPNYKFILCCECILRRLEVLDKALVEDMNSLIKRYNVIGFHSYGEQFNSVHVNQTFTGFILGD
ncbi:MAG: hypothetical protein GF307_09370 [candidate division Zixibacteria bacterium]|nr:hypothetical protein [candidate division Zixibacteria bacterium]